jgi:hypothetical protein
MLSIKMNTMCEEFFIEVGMGVGLGLVGGYIYGVANDYSKNNIKARLIYDNNNQFKDIFKFNITPVTLSLIGALYGASILIVSNII